MQSHKQIVFLASYPKSGNTWVRMFLDAYFLGEVDINDIVCSVADDNSLRYQIGDGSDIRDLPIELQQLARPMAMLRLVRTYNENRMPGVPLFVKTHSAHMIANGIELLPEGLTKSVIHIVRDPRDVLPSFSTHMGLSLDDGLKKMEDDYNVLTAGKNAAKVGDFTGSWYSHTRSFLNADTHNVRTFRYEDMKADPVGQFAEILRHSGVKPDMDQVENALALCELSKLKKQEDEKGFKEQSPHAKFFGREHEHITPKHKHRIEKKFGRLLKRLGYETRIKAVH